MEEKRRTNIEDNHMVWKTKTPSDNLRRKKKKRMHT